ncbi:SRPBCC family protein [Microbacterium lushaniae]|nr:SRPBCC family protein [Microbacterium lushaniae]KAA9154089.1 SRPBCC family protein [Microbacterium lushaniae]
MTDSTTPTPTGSTTDGPLGREVRLHRRFHAPMDAVWAAMTESARLERWIGRWEGDPATGTITFFMTAEGEDVEGQEFRIQECVPPQRFCAETRTGSNLWQVRFDLQDEGGTTRLTFAQVLGSDDPAMMGPGWEYYLDRLGATLSGGDLQEIRFEQYHPAMCDHYAG